MSRIALNFIVTVGGVTEIHYFKTSDWMVSKILGNHGKALQVLYKYLMNKTHELVMIKAPFACSMTGVDFRAVEIPEHIVTDIYIHYPPDAPRRMSRPVLSTTRMNTFVPRVLF